MDKLLGVNEVCEILKERPDQVYALARRGIIPSVRLGRKVKFSEREIQEFIRNGGQALPGGWREEG